MSLFDTINTYDMKIIKRYCDERGCAAKVSVSDDYTVYIEKDGVMTWYRTDSEIDYAAALLAADLQRELAKGIHTLYRPRGV